MWFQMEKLCFPGIFLWVKHSSYMHDRYLIAGTEYLLYITANLCLSFLMSHTVQEMRMSLL